MSLKSIDLEPDEAPPSLPPPLPSRPPTAPASQVVAAPPSQRVTAPPSQRVTGDELVATIFEKVHALSFAEDALEAARCCLEILGDLVPCKTSVVHLFDAARDEFLIAFARGEGAEDLVLLRHSVRDPLLRVAMPRGNAFAWNNLGNAPVASVARFACLVNVRRVLVAPILRGGRYLGAIELIDPQDGEPFGADDEHAVGYVADHLASFLSEHGVIVDVATVARFAFSDAEE